MDSTRHVFVFTRVEHTARRGLVHGIGQFAKEQAGWDTVIPWDELDCWTLPARRRVSGVIAFPQTDAERDFLLGLDVPVVCSGPHFVDSPLPRVTWDDQAAGAMAVRHLADNGLRRLAFVGANMRRPYVEERRKGSCAEAETLGARFISFDMEPGSHKPEKASAVILRTRKWIRSLEYPVGVVAASDAAGLSLLRAAEAEGIRVPEDLAVISIGGDNLICPFSQPGLSSVVLPGQEVGYRAAELLNALMDGRPAARSVQIAPQRVETRKSSDVVASGDEMVDRALRFIRAHAHSVICVDDILAAVPLSRRPLEIRFKHSVGRTMQKEIWRVHIERAKDLLAESDLPIAEISELSGFPEPQRMTEVFIRELGEAPATIRKSMRRSYIK